MFTSPALRQIMSLFALYLLMSGVSGQTAFHSKKALKLFEKGREAYEARNYSSAIADLNAALAEDPRYAEAYLLLADIEAESVKSSYLNQAGTRLKTNVRSGILPFAGFVSKR